MKKGDRYICMVTDNKYIKYKHVYTVSYVNSGCFCLKESVQTFGISYIKNQYLVPISPFEEVMEQFS